MKVLPFLLLPVTLSPVVLAQGPLAPPAGPPVPGMKTLDQIEPRTTIPGGAATVTISQPGSYVLAGNITVSSGDAIIIAANDVTLDLNGFTLSSTALPAQGRGINVDGQRRCLAISNGHIRSGTVYNEGSFTLGPGFVAGIDAGTADPNFSRVSQVTIVGMASYGMDLGYDATSTVTDCVVSLSKDFGIMAGAVSNSSATKCGQYAIIATATSNCVGSLAKDVSPKVIDSVADSVREVKAENQVLAGLLSASSVNFAWNLHTIDNTVAVGRTSLKFRRDGEPVIAYHDSGNQDLKVARHGVNGWAVASVDSAGSVGDYCSLAIGPDGEPGIAYYDATNTDLKYTKFNGSSWQTVTVETSPGDVGQYASLAFSPGGLPYISYYDATSTNLKIARFNGNSTWFNETVDNSAANVGQWTSLAFGPDGQPAISYLDGATNYDLKYARFNGSSWAIETIDVDSAIGRCTSLAFGPDGLPAISHVLLSSEVVRVARFNGSTWTMSSLGSAGNTSGTSSLAFGPDGQPAVCYAVSPLLHLEFGRYNGSAWSSSPINASNQGGSNLSLAFGPDGQPAVSHSIPGQGLRIARKGIFAQAP